MDMEKAGIVDDYTKDGTVDLKGNRVRGGWKACYFLVGMFSSTLYSVFLFFR